MTGWLTSTFYRYALSGVGLFFLAACGAAPQPLNPTEAQALMTAAWHVPHHIIWELDWPAAPTGGPITVEVWQDIPRYRYELLEAVAPALVGQTLTFDDHRAWFYNRLEPKPPVRLSEPALSPVSDAFTLIDRLLTATPQAATTEMVQLPSGPAQKITTTFANGDSLSLWREPSFGLPVRVELVWQGQPLTLQARSFVPLINPPTALFRPVK
jgi:hypothetical protein